MFPFSNRAKDRISTASQKAQTYSIAVLPLRNLLGKPELDYFSDSMTSVLITSLAKQQNIRVISLTSAMAYKNVSKPIADIARELNVGPCRRRRVASSRQTHSNLVTTRREGNEQAYLGRELRPGYG